MFCQTFRCPGVTVGLFVEMLINSTLGVLLNWFHLLGTLGLEVLPMICLYHLLLLNSALLLAEPYPPPTYFPIGAKNVGRFQPVFGI